MAEPALLPLPSPTVQEAAEAARRLALRLCPGATVAAVQVAGWICGDASLLRLLEALGPASDVSSGVRHVEQAGLAWVASAPLSGSGVLGGAGLLAVGGPDMPAGGAPEAALNDAAVLLGAVVEGQEQAHLHSMLVAGAVDAIVVVDERGIICSANPAVERMFGHPANGLIGRNVSLLMPDSHAAAHDGYMRRYRNTGRGAIIGSGRQLEGRRADGSVFPLELTLSVVDLPGRRLFAGIVRDISERVAQQRRLEAANRAKTDFLSSMSHELRTPLNAILGFSQVMLEDNGGGEAGKSPLDDRQRHCLDHIRRAGRHLLELINEVLDLSRVEAGTLTLSLEPLYPGPVIDECLGVALTLGEAAGLRVIDGRMQDAPPVVADFTRLRQVLLNLLSNAVKYNRPGGTVTLVALPVGTMLRISVSDTGRGIPAERLDQVFEPFNRLGAETTAIEGTGIGLTLTRILVQDMGGRIGVTSTPDVGSTFWVDLPLAAADARPALQPASPSAPSVISPPPSDGPPSAQEPNARQLVLYVEDNPANLRLMEEICRDLHDITLISAHTAELGIDMAIDRQPALILMDINLPGMNGIQAVARLREDARTAAIPVIALSANAMQAAVRRALDAGFATYLTKPVVLEDLRAAIRKALAVSAGERLESTDG